ncbi:SMC-Scp complex subunit ScpB [Halobacillus halophilus]|uniref:SMC-Scp complex subunit ScpB n=1 Tax=Halobacillus halophilus TaxID=1570 RepID=UPI001CD45931|nr:SMC-Scp complex subunit ScpB [Halobacillus halophilus]MCA1009517.1 SMC-Scp complex subunit ScpB [Halobacillus halophilus]
MELEEYKAIVEGLLFASGDEGLTRKKISTLLEISQKELNDIVEELKQDYQSPHRGVTIMDSHGVLHLTTKPEHASYYKRMIDSPGNTRLSQAALETLAIVAYQQPITRIEIDDLRGVKSDRAVQTLVNRGLIEEKGRKEAIGRPVLFGTTKDFLIYFGLTSLSELPPLSELTEAENVEEEADLFFGNFTATEE